METQTRSFPSNTLFVILGLLLAVWVIGMTGYYMSAPEVGQHGVQPIEPNFPLPDDSEAPTACTMDAKICPDGSAVGRTGPNCEFAPCPELLQPGKLR